MAGDPAWDSVWQAAATTDRSGALLLVALAIGLVLALVAAAVWARWGAVRRRAWMGSGAAASGDISAEAALADPLAPLSS